MPTPARAYGSRADIGLDPRFSSHATPGDDLFRELVITIMVWHVNLTSVLVQATAEHECGTSHDALMARTSRDTRPYPQAPATHEALREPPISRCRAGSGIIRRSTAGAAGLDRGWIVRNYDLEFLKRFSMVLAFLALVTLGLILFAHHLNSKVVHTPDPAVREHLLARLAPVGEVYAGATGAASQAAAAAAAQAALVANVPFGGRTDGAEIFNNGPCTGCHTAGVGGAPKLDAAGIGARAAQQGVEELVHKAIAGFTGTAGVMPAKGGNPALTDEQVKAAVEWMVGQSK